jgi:hypothetical protein
MLRPDYHKLVNSKTLTRLFSALLCHQFAVTVHTATTTASNNIYIRAQHSTVNTACVPSTLSIQTANTTREFYEECHVTQHAAVQCYAACDVLQMATMLLTNAVV